MTNEEINEGNLLIARFITDEPKVLERDLKKAGILESMHYHDDWNWLMPIIEKIESLGFWFNIKKNHVTVAWDNKGSFDSKMIHSEFGDLTKIERVYSCVVAFIKYYNEQRV